MTSRDAELVAECTRLIEELQESAEEMTEWERTFIGALENRIIQYGDATYITENQKKKLDEIYERIF